MCIIIIQKILEKNKNINVIFKKKISDPLMLILLIVNWCWMLTVAFLTISEEFTISQKNDFWSFLMLVPEKLLEVDNKTYTMLLTQTQKLQ